MTAGDLMAQELEQHDLSDHFAGSTKKSLKDVPVQRRLSLRRYGTIGGEPLINKKESDYDKLKSSNPLLHDGVTVSSNWREIANFLFRNPLDEVQQFDLSRTVTMVFWSVGIYTPGYMWLFRQCDRVLPKTTPFAITARVALMLTFSIPINIAFFGYGTTVHHVMEWNALREEQKEKFTGRGIEPAEVSRWVRENGPKLDVETLLSKIRLKLDSELITTITTSAKVWVPINFINFSLVPPHFRPLGLMIGSIFWNCYLSLVQHRYVALPGQD